MGFCLEAGENCALYAMDIARACCIFREQPSLVLTHPFSNVSEGLFLHPRRCFFPRHGSLEVLLAWLRQPISQVPEMARSATIFTNRDRCQDTALDIATITTAQEHHGILLEVPTAMCDACFDHPLCALAHTIDAGIICHPCRCSQHVCVQPREHLCTSCSFSIHLQAPNDRLRPIHQLVHRCRARWPELLALHTVELPRMNVASPVRSRHREASRVCRARATRRCSTCRPLYCHALLHQCVQLGLAAYKTTTCMRLCSISNT